MSLDALAPDQRAVVQLVLQQGRSYADLAGLLQIAEPAVRERAQRGLVALADPGDLDVTEQGEVVDYLLGQGSPSAREATRSLLRSDASHNAWAAALAATLADLPGARLPEVPELVQRRRRAAAEPDTAAEPGVPQDAIDAGADPTAPGTAPPEDLGTAAAGLGADVDADDLDAPAPEVRARPRPARAQRPAAGSGRAGRAGGAGAALTDERDAAPDAPRSSKLGGALLLGVAAIAVVVVVVVLLTRGDDGTETASGGATATPTAAASASATADPDARYQAAGQIALQAPAGSEAQGAAIVYLDQRQQTITFVLQATGLAPGNSYAIWLVGGPKPVRIGFNADAPVGEDGQLQIRGPIKKAPATRFTREFTRAKQIVVSRETSADATAPADIVLSGEIPSASATPTATP